ncbi:MAG: hypothetical protein ABI609_14645 [Acidobacteriota bacterium]
MAILSQRFWGTRALLALLLVALPVADVHSHCNLWSVAPGTLVAMAAVHPGAATHLEASTTQAVPRCPACDLAQQTTAALDAMAQGAVEPTPSPLVFPEVVERSATASPAVAVRGPPSV